MFGNLVASCLLAGAVAVNVPKASLTTDEAITLEMPKRVSNNGAVSGAYCLKHYDTQGVFFSEPLFDHDVNLSITNGSDFDSNQAIYGVYQGADGNGSTKYNCEFSLLRAFSIDYSSQDNEINIIIDFDIYVTGDIYYCSIGQGDNYSEAYYVRSESSRGFLDKDYFAVYFLLDFYLTDEERTLFNTVFTADLNNNFTYYSGWYHMNESNNFITDDANVLLLGNFLVDNFYYNYLYYWFTASSFSISSKFVSSVNSNQNYIFDIYSNNKWNIHSRNVMFTNVVMTDVALDYLEDFGTFNFIRDTETYTLTDMFIDIADTPIIFITSMFDFRLFGTTFYIAFLGILTVIAIMFILRKVL